MAKGSFSKRNSSKDRRHRPPPPSYYTEAAQDLDGAVVEWDASGPRRKLGNSSLRQNVRLSVAYMDVGEGREQDAVSFAYMDNGMDPLPFQTGFVVSQNGNSRQTI